jgi:glucokinase
LLAIGIDVGGTKILGALIDEHGKILAEQRVASPAQDAAEIVAAVAKLVGLLQAQADREIVGVGVAVAGFIDADASTVLFSPNLDFRNEPLKAKIAAQISLPVVVENDANAAGWAEFAFGAARGTKDMIMLTLGTGVGGAVVSDGELRRGGFGIAGELGHLRLVPDGRLCGCGQRGCLEQYSSGTAVLKAAKKLASSDGPAGARLAQLQAESGELTGHHVYQALLEGDSAALSLVNEAGSHLGAAIGSFVAILDPQVVVIGGGLSEAGDLILDPIRQSYLKHLPARGYRPELEIVSARFSNQSGVLGAADLARQSLSKL